MFKRIFVLIVVLFAAISCKQNPSSLLSSTPPTADDGTIDDNTDGGNSNGGNTDGGNTDSGSNSGYGVYNVLILGDDDITIMTNKYKISDTYKMLDAYTNMILNDKKESKFNLYKNNTASTLAESSGSEDSDTAVSDIYTFDKDLNIIKVETTDGASKNTAATTTIYKKFRGVCIVRIYPKIVKTSDFSLVGEYTLAGVYTEMIESAAGNGLQNYGYDELIVLRYDEKLDATSLSSTASAVKYRADILFNTDKSINLYYYDPNRTFEKQNTDYIFERIAETTTIE